MFIIFLLRKLKPIFSTFHTLAHGRFGFSFLYLMIRRNQYHRTKPATDAILPVCGFDINTKNKKKTGKI